MRMTILLCLAVLGGCANYTTPIVPQRQMTPAERNFEAVWEGALRTLSAYRFPIDQENRRDGVITTLPVTGQQWFEFWRKDAATGRSLAEGSLQTIYRTARVHVEPVQGSQGRFAARVEVFTSRSDRITRDLTDVSEVYSLFAIPGNREKLERMLVNQSVEDLPGAAVTPLGRDGELESKLAMDIAKRVANRQVSAGSNTTAAQPAEDAEKK